jgi:hypothetical protein
MHLYIYIYIGKLVPLHPCVLVSLIVASRGCRSQVRLEVPPWWGVPIVDRHDRVLPGEGHRATCVRDFIEFHASSEGP